MIFGVVDQKHPHDGPLYVCMKTYEMAELSLNFTNVPVDFVAGDWSSSTSLTFLFLAV